MFREARYKWKKMTVGLWLFNTNNVSPNEC